MHTVRFYLDFISPYVWLALLEAEAFGKEHGIRWQVEPVVYAGLLNETGLVGPVEVSAKRAYTFDDVVRCARRLGRDVVGPPSHPFRSLEALRTLWLFRDNPGALGLARSISHATWGGGADLTDLAVLQGQVEACGLDAGNLEARLQDPTTKQGLMDSTSAAIERGVFGVPTFEFEGELFWGHDRLPHLADRLQGRLGPSRKSSQGMIDRVGSARRR